MEKKQLNPFVVGKYVSDEYFCDREEETHLMLKQLKNGRNITLISDRRLGKSGLISHVFAQSEIRQQFYTIYVDLYSTSSLAELTQLFSKAVYSCVNQQIMSWRDRFFQIVSSLRLGFKLDVITGAPSFDIGIADIPSPSVTLEQIFSFINQLDKPCIVAFDEFQQITVYPEKRTDALLRTFIQQCKHAQFVFAGSRKHMMTQLFLSPTQPFYQSTINIGLDPLDKEVYINFAQRMFEKGGKQVAKEAVSQVYDMFRGITWYVQLMLNEMYTLVSSKEKCTSKHIALAIENVILVQSPFYVELLAALPAKQKSLLYAIVKDHEVRNISSADFIKRHGLNSASSVQSALKGLREKDLLTEHEGCIMIYDVFLEKFIEQQNR